MTISVEIRITSLTNQLVICVQSSMKTKAFSYLRVSGIAQAGKDRNGFPRQRDAISAFAKRQKIEVVKEFRDEGISGTTSGFDRPGLSALMAEIEDSGIRMILLERTDRLGRDLLVSEILINECRLRKISIVTSEGTTLTSNDETTPTQTLVRQVLTAFSQYEKSLIVSKLAAARRRVRSKKGRCEGDLPYGQKKGELQLIERIQSLRIENPRISQKIICEVLTVEGFRTRKGTCFSQSQISRILNSA